MKFTNAILFCTSALIHLSASQNVECPSEGIFYLPHSTCTKFIICLDGEVIEMTCPFSLYYNQETSQCDFSENVVECRGATRPPTRTTSTTKEPSTTTTGPPSNTQTSIFTEDSDLTSQPTVSSTTSTKEPSTTTEKPPDELKECGQSIIADNGTIRYKLNETYDAGELCVFMIRFESGALNTTFTLETDGLSESDPDALTILTYSPTLSFRANLGLRQRNVSLNGYGAVVIFRTNSSLGTGFQLSFKRDTIIYSVFLAGTTVGFNNEEDLPLSIPFPSKFTSEIYNYFVFTSGSKLITKPGTLFRLAVRAWAEDNYGCSEGFWVYSFVNVLHLEENICQNLVEGKIYHFATRGLFIVHQQQLENPPVYKGNITWNTDSTN